MPDGMVKKSDPIIIVGGGAFGLSTALHLLRRQYTDITVFEQDAQIPSKYSAANDLNKIMRVEYEDPWYTDLTYKALEGWKTPLFAPYFHQVGFLHCVSATAPQRAIDTLNRFRDAALRDARVAKHVSDISQLSDIRDDYRCWQFSGDFPGWKGYLNKLDGYTHSANALRGIHRHVSTRGVKFKVDPVAGSVREILYDSNTNKTTGVKTRDGSVHESSLVIIAAGAMAAKLLPGIGQQVVAKSWSVAHVRLSDDETASLRGIPVAYARDLGFLFEPDPATNLLKICPMGGGYINTDQQTGVSLPPDDWSQTVDILPVEDEKRIRQLLRETIPALADRPLVNKALCWFADTEDSDFIVDYVPGTDRSVIVLSGDSGHGFKMFPIVGGWSADLLENGSKGQPIHRWQWKGKGRHGAAIAGGLGQYC
ncbi:FAD dependent oxidoreductase [Microdochium trichocladiopsis]|uniref:FAD dependent oxidoreductase n=1 Tax=Microdochium trichocladiopsis TaxID=1682393 RepID=A0A9P8Y3N6_9PEZI|nr:FAD dependent oxidoreductase [Microdochium trichocladiopsis]KAH7028775.1 FAD dependent oxidoreductase [Microdochium trichocladiopsis]